MQHSIYVLVASGFRYVALLILLLVFINILRLSIMESRRRKEHPGEIPQGYVGVLDVHESGKREYQYGLLQDCMVGRSKRCDIALKDKDMASVHAHVYLQSGQLYITPMSGKVLKVNGQRVRGRTAIGQGDELTMGSTKMGVRLFEMEVPHGKHR
jgi:hypothetical protein